MAKLFADRSSDLALRALRPFVESWMRKVALRADRVGPGVDFKRRKPFLLLANHSFAMDVVQVPLPFAITPHIVASRDLFVSPALRFVLTFVARCIMATKGGGDLRTVAGIRAAVASGYPVLLFPEGDISFFGQSAPLPKSAAALARSLGLDVITCRVAGGYLSLPRWAKSPREGRRIELGYELALRGDEIGGMGLPEIHEALASRLTHDEWAYQKRAMIARPSRAPAEGLEDILYVCPACHGLLSLRASGARLYCSRCGADGRLDDYGFLEGWPFRTLAEWDAFQRCYDDELRAASFETGGELWIHDYAKLTRRRLGRAIVRYRAGELDIEGEVRLVAGRGELRELALTGRSDLNFGLGGVDYFLRLDGLALPLLRALGAA